MSTLVQLNMSQLAKAAARSRPLMQWDAILLVQADFDMEGQFAHGAGVGVGMAALQSALTANRPAPGIVFIGLLPEIDFRSKVNRFHGVDHVLGWPGFRYLRMPFSTEDLGKEVEAALKGRSFPVPLPTASILLSSIASVLHWLERVRQGQAGTSRIFADVARGDFALPRRCLEPESCLSPKQRDGLQRLCESLSLAIEIENGTEMASLLRNDIAAQDVASQRFERTKAAYHSTTNVPGPKGLQILSEQASSLAEKANVLFERVKFIEVQIVKGATGKND